MRGEAFNLFNRTVFGAGKKHGVELGVGAADFQHSQRGVDVGGKNGHGRIYTKMIFRQNKQFGVPLRSLKKGWI